MLVQPRAWALSALFVAGLAAALAGVGCGGGGGKSTDTSAGKKPATAASTDPMYAVSDHSVFTSTGKQQGGWYWLKSENAKARWEFSRLPAHSTDLVAELRVLAPAKVATAHFYLSYGTRGANGDETLARAEAKLPVTQTDHQSGQGLARYELVIPARSLPASATSLWVQAALADDSNTRPPINAQLAFRKESVRFAPLVRPSRPLLPGSEGTTTETSGRETTTETTDRAPTPAGVPKPPPPPPDTGLTTTTGVTTTNPKPPPPPPDTGLQPFTVDGDYINGWYWLRDAAYQQSATWTFTTPSKGTNVTLGFEVLATSGINGPRDVDARFYLSYGPLPETRPAASIPTRLITLPNVSPASDPVGYTTRGTITLTNVMPTTKTRDFWVKITRIDSSRSHLTVSEHIAVNQDSVKVLGVTADGGTTTTTDDGTTTGGTTTTGDQEVLTCDGGTLSADSFAPVQSAARWWTDKQTEKWFLMRTMGDALTNSLPEGYLPGNQSATWRFSALPAGSGDVRVRFSMPMLSHINPQMPPSMVHASLFLTYGALPAPAGSERIGGPITVAVRPTGETPSELPPGLPSGHSSSHPVTWQSYPIYSGEAVLPRAALAGDGGYWLRLALANPLNTADYEQAQPALNQQSAKVCTGGLPTTPASSPVTTSSPTVSWDKNTKTLTSSSSVFTDPATDLDGDGINQNFENTASALVEPILEFDEDEDWVDRRGDWPASMLVDVTPWPSYADVKYVLFEYLTTYAYDSGVGANLSALQLAGVDVNKVRVRLAIEEHRGDSEKIYEAYRVVDSTHLRLDWVMTSAHDDGTVHNAVWSPNRQRCNVGHLIKSDNVTFGKTELTETICSGLEFGGPRGELLVYPGEDKHAVYPTKAACEQTTLVEFDVHDPLSMALDYFAGTSSASVPFYVRETCGYDPLIDLGDFDGDSHYLGDGHWRLSLFNVGEPGNWLVDSLSDSAGWRGLSQAQLIDLMNKYPNEHVWTGLNGVSTDFCGGLPLQTGNQNYPSKCSGRPGAKYDSPPSGSPGNLLMLLKCSVDGAECPATHSGHSGKP